MHLQPIFAENDFITAKGSIKDLSEKETGISVSEDIFNRGLCLPSDIKNTSEDMDFIISIVRKCFGK